MHAMISYRIETPIGGHSCYIRNGAVVAAHFDLHESRSVAFLRKHFPGVPIVASNSPCVITEAIQEYFRGNVHSLARIALNLQGTTFQQRVWEALAQIGPGETITYGDLARAIAQPTAQRAVAQAVKLNPISLLNPCHRVIGKKGGLTGYGGAAPEGLRLKSWLLDHEHHWKDRVTDKRQDKSTLQPSFTVRA